MFAVNPKAGGSSWSFPKAGSAGEAGTAWAARGKADSPGSGGTLKHKLSETELIWGLFVYFCCKVGSSDTPAYFT